MPPLAPVLSRSCAAKIGEGGRRAVGEVGEQEALVEWRRCGWKHGVGLPHVRWCGACGA